MADSHQNFAPPRLVSLNRMAACKVRLRRRVGSISALHPSHIAQPTVRYCAQAHGTESETSIGLEENLGFCFSMCHKSRFEFERYSSAATVAARFPHSAGVHWRIASNSRVPGSCSSGIAHRAPLCANELSPIDQDVHQALEVQRVQLRVDPICFKPFRQAMRPSIGKSLHRGID